MITKINKRNKNEHIFITELLNTYSDPDFYFTDHNSRLYITDNISLKKMFRNSSDIYVSPSSTGDYNGVILVWTSLGGGKKRYYVKVSANNLDTVERLLSVLLWNFDRELFIKIRKNSKFLKVFKKKGFKFVGGRGIQVLLHRKPVIKEKSNGSNTNRDRNIS